MRMHVGATLLLLTAQLSTIASAQNASLLNGWYSCSEYTFAQDGSSPSDAECAVYTAPLCYANICTDAKARTVDIFVKRIPAVANAVSAPNVWFLQGGPGAGSTAMESAMTILYQQLNGNVNVYTMDHRGTGRSTKLDCVAAQATMSGSPAGSSFTPSEVASCAADLAFKYGDDLSAFSITSAATDVSRLITLVQSTSTKAKTIVYGVSYGTTLVERLMHLDNAAISGYVLDGIATSSGVTDPTHFEFYSTWDADFGEVSASFIDLCDNDAACSSRFPSSASSTTLRGVLTDVIKRFDASPNSPCAALVRDLTSGERGVALEPASYTLRKALGALFMSSRRTRSLIAPLMYRLNRCSKSVDVAVLTHFFNYSSSSASDASPIITEDDAFESTLLYYLITFSELWESPAPSVTTLRKRFTDTLICNGGAASDVPLYCAFTQEQSPTCVSLQTRPYKAGPIAYPKDKYWNVAAAPRASASVLLFSSKLDPQTPHKYAEYLFEVLDTTAKELVTFEHATHGTLFTSAMSTSSSSITCGMRILLSYVKSGADLAKLDTTCVAKMPPLSFAVDEDAQAALLSTSDAYDGVFDASLSKRAAAANGRSTIGTSDDDTNDDNSDTKSYKTVFVVFLVLFLVALIAAALFAFGWIRQRRRQRNNAAKAAATAAAATRGGSVQSQPTSGDDVSDNSPTTAFQQSRP